MTPAFHIRCLQPLSSELPGTRKALFIFGSVLSPPVHLDLHLSVSRRAAHAAALPEDCRTDGFCLSSVIFSSGGRETNGQMLAV